MRVIIFVFLFGTITTHFTQAKLMRDLSLIDIDIESVSKDCEHQVKAIITALASIPFNRSNTWALMMLDAGTRLVPSGIMYGDFFDIGNYDECLSIETYVGDAPKILGQYCLTTIPFKKKASITPNQQGISEVNQTFSDFEPRMLGMMDTKSIGLHLAFCVPNQCTAEDLNAGLSPIFNSNFCTIQDADKQFSARAIIGIVFFSTVACIAVISTTYDVYLQYSGRKPSSRLFIAFSVYTNGTKTFETSKDSDKLLCINGLKAISMMWVLIGHEYSLQGFANNYLSIINWMNKSENMFIIGATVSVDTFFTIGGLLTVYAFLSACDKGIRFNIILYYVHRYLRLTPALVAVIIFYVTLLPYVGDGPLWPIVRRDMVKGCENSWWEDLLYIQNYALNYMDTSGICIAQTWYLGVDMQLFLLSPLILIPLHKWPKYTLWALVLLVIAGVVCPFYISWAHKISGLIIKMDVDGMKKYYMATHARFGPYVIGMLAGYLIYHMKKSNMKLRVRKIYISLFWMLLLAGFVAIVYGGHDLIKNEDRLNNALFVAFHRSAWSLGISLLIVACISGYGGPINSFLSLAPFQFIAKLSYSMYLVHFAVIQARIASAKSKYYFSNLEMFFLFWGYFTETLIISLALCLLFESPMITIEKLLIGGSPKKSTKEVEKP